VAATTGASQALRIEAVDSAYVFLITLDSENCGPQFSATYTAGEAWEAYTDARLVGSWFVRPDARDRVVSPAGRHGAPCEVAALAPRDEMEAAVLCSDRRVFRTFDSGRTWDDGVQVPGAVALDDTVAGYVVAATGLEGCDGVQIATVLAEESDESVDVRGCVPSAAPARDVTVGAAGASIWVWAGEEVSRSLDEGETWG
ncbi:MAG: hypothetical protein JWO69_1268, partial [Thermoleophilia bacterium]|nr:hypothetical protein [Thermoleophilia bacterium]